MSERIIGSYDDALILIDVYFTLLTRGLVLSFLYPPRNRTPDGRVDAAFTPAVRRSSS